MNKLIMQLQHKFDKEYLCDCPAYYSLRVNNLINSLLCIDTELKTLKLNKHFERINNNHEKSRNND